MPQNSPSLQLKALLLCLTLFGCGSESKVRVTGTITCDGKLLEAGEIYLIDESKSSPPVWAAVQQGKFEALAIPGRKRIEIRATRQKIQDKKDPDAAGLREDYIPSRYNRESTLTEVITHGLTNDLRYEITTP